MLGLLPYERLNQPLDVFPSSSSSSSDPFKSYNHRPTPHQMSLHHHQPSYYTPFATSPTSYMRAVERQRHSDAMEATKLDYHRLANSSYNPLPPTGVTTGLPQHHSGSSSFGFYNNSTPTLMNMFDATPPPSSAHQPSAQQLHPPSIAIPGLIFSKSDNNMSGCNNAETDCQYLPTTGHKERSSQQHSGAPTAGEENYLNETGRSNVRITSSSITTMTSSSSCGDNSSPEGGGSRTNFASDGSGRNRRSKKLAMPVPSELKDTQYWDKRKKNNESAKRSREARRRQESVLAKNLAGLEQEYVKLKADIAVFSNEIEQLRMYLMPGSGSFNDHSDSEKQQQQQQQQRQQQHLQQMQRHIGLL